MTSAFTCEPVVVYSHEDGSVRFWDVSTTSQRLLYTLKTATVFGADAGPAEGNDEEGWPPFKKVGTFDPYSDDPRLSVQKLTLCPLSETLVVSGTAGQTLVMQWEREERAQDIKVTHVSTAARSLLLLRLKLLPVHVVLCLNVPNAIYPNAGR